MDWKQIDIETKNKHMQLIIRNANSRHSDLVEMSINPLCCGECSKYQGRIYSLTGRDHRFPKLPEVVIQTGVLHKDCSHMVYNYTEGNEPLYIKGNIFEVSNRPFVDERSDEEKHEYYRDKEGVTIEVMSSIPNMPFNLYKAIRYDDRYPYIKMDAENRVAAEDHISIINAAINAWNPKLHGIDLDLFIPIDAAVKAKIICTPYTNSLKLAKVPISLHIETNNVSMRNSVVGDIFYQSTDGSILRATMCFWKNKKQFVLHFSRLDNCVIVSKSSVH